MGGLGNIHTILRVEWPTFIAGLEEQDYSVKRAEDAEFAQRNRSSRTILTLKLETENLTRFPPLPCGP